jgi:hypothetical protein
MSLINGLTDCDDNNSLFYYFRTERIATIMESLFSCLCRVMCSLSNFQAWSFKILSLNKTSPLRTCSIHYHFCVLHYTFSHTTCFSLSAIHQVLLLSGNTVLSLHDFFYLIFSVQSSAAHYVFFGVPCARPVYCCYRSWRVEWYILGRLSLRKCNKFYLQK